MSSFYNEHDPFAAQWLRLLIQEGLIADGIVDERDIRDIVPDELAGYDQYHFFAGIGGWSLALRMGGWPDDRPVWTGSCPCQPFSAAGRGGGFSDERHLWPAFFHLIRECRPATVFGEQVASPAGLGWLDLVYADLEGAGYAVGAADLCAASIGAPHIRQRLWWVGDARSEGRRQVGSDAGGCGEGSRAQGLVERSLHERARRQWSDLEWLPCQDGKSRPTQPGIQPLAHGIPNRVGTLRGAGNAIVPQAGAMIVQTMREYLDREAA